MFIGHIPSSMRNLPQLELLDFSWNKFSGEIPQQLAQLTFIESFNVSYNNVYRIYTTRKLIWYISKYFI